MKLIAVTQYHENYEFDADGCVVLPGYWKAKGGTEYVVARNIPFVTTERMEALVDAKRSEMEWDNDASRSSVISWYVIGDNDLTQWEADQKEFDGGIDSPSPDLTVAPVPA